MSDTGAFPGGTPPLDVSNLSVAQDGVAVGIPAVRSSLLATLAAFVASLLSPQSEGTFVPTITLGGTAVTSYTQQVGTYTRIGKRVYFSMRLVINVKGAGVGVVRLQGLPFVVGAGLANSYHSCSMYGGAYLGYAGAECPIAYCEVGQTYVQPAVMVAGNPVQMADTNVQAGTSFIVTGHYIV